MVLRGQALSVRMRRREEATAWSIGCQVVRQTPSRSSKSQYNGTAKSGERMRIALASDHAGYEYKERIAVFLKGENHVVRDFGTYSACCCDYPDFVRPAATAVASGWFDRGIVLGGSGNGEAMAANKTTGIRCALCWNVRSARLSRAHNDANMLSLGARMMSIETALEIVGVWLDTAFEGGRHVRRIGKIEHGSE